MNFTSPEFLIFFPVVLVLYYVIPARRRWVLLLVASWAFYLTWNPWTGILLMLATACSYVAGLRIEGARKFDTVKSRRAVNFWSFVGIGVPLACLLVFKYAGFFANTTSALLAQIGVQTNISLPRFVLPIGISFYTFQTLSYVIDVRRGTISAERHFGFYALFVSFFPQLVAGPIERPGNLIPQLRKVCGMGEDAAVPTQKKPFGMEEDTAAPTQKNPADAQTAPVRNENLAAGFMRILVGFFKKLAVADYLASFVEPVYANPTAATASAVLLATVLFAIQIYCDFSGYSDIACGAARMMGINLTENFRLPYLAGSVREFWRRWHITLSSWLTDYIYIPLGGNRRGLARQIANVLLVFLISGLWHGANVTFVVWGLLHGGMVCAEILFSARIGESKAGLTFAFVCFTWIFFRAESLRDAGILIGRLFSVPEAGAFAETVTLMGLTARSVIHIVLVLWCLVLLDVRQGDSWQREVQQRDFWQREARQREVRQGETCRKAMRPGVGETRGGGERQLSSRKAFGSPESRAMLIVIMVMTVAASWLMLLADHAGNVFIYFRF